MIPHSNRWLIINSLDTGTQLFLFVYVLRAKNNHQNLFNEAQEFFQNFFLIFILGSAVLTGATLYTLVIRGHGQYIVAYFNLWSDLAPGSHK